MIPWIVGGLVGYAVGVLFVARMLSSKWHPDGGKGVTGPEGGYPWWIWNEDEREKGET